MLKDNLRRFSNEFSDMTIKQNDIQFNVIMGLISSALLFIIEFLSYFTVNRQTISHPYLYLVAAMIMLFQFGVFYKIYHNKYILKNIIEKTLVYIHPYLIIGVGIMITYMYQGFSNQLDSFILSVMAVSIIQIYPFKKRILIFSFACIAFTVFMWLYHGSNLVFYGMLRFAFMAVLLGYVFSVVQYLTLENRKKLMKQIVEQSNMQLENLERLRNVNYELQQSHKITEMMHLISSEILKSNEFDEVLSLILNKAVDIIPNAQAGSILIRSGEKMEFKASFGYDLERLRAVDLNIQDLFQSKFTDIYKPHVIKNLELFDEAHLPEEKSNKLKTQGALIAKAVLTCSFKLDNDFYGTINVDNFIAEDAFNNLDKEMIKQLSKQIEVTVGIHKLYEKAIYPTRFDALTKAHTRSYFHELLGKYYREAKHNVEPFSIVSFDLNLLKRINDEYGHNVGDAYLEYFSSSIMNNIRPQDLFGRMGGDEFILIMKKTTHNQALNKIEKFSYLFEHKPFVYRTASIHLSYGCGVSSFPIDGETLFELIRISDARMYANKKEIKEKMGLISE